MFSFGFLRPSKRSSIGEQRPDSDESDSDDEVVVKPPGISLASGKRASGVADSVQRSTSAPSGKFLSQSRRRGIDMVIDEPTERPKSLRDSPVYSSDNGMQLLPEVGKPGSLMDPRFFCDVAEWKETTDWMLVKAQHLSTDMAILAKVYERAHLIPSKEVQIICQERILAKLSAVDGVIRYYRTLSDLKHICLIFHQDLRPTLKTFVAIHGGRLREHYVVQRVAAPLVVLLTEIHRQGIIHRNLAPEHLLFSEDRPITLTGFDNAVDTHPINSAEDDFQPGLPNFRVGNLEYMAPEVVNKPTPQEIFHEVVFKGMAEEELPMYDTKADIFSLGIMLYRIMTGRVPWDATTPSELLSAHRNANICQMLDDNCVDLSSDCRDFLCQCLQIQSDPRASGAVLLRHSWIRSHVEQAKIEFRIHSPPKEIRSRKTSSEIARKSLSMATPESELPNTAQEYPASQSTHISAVGKVTSRPGHVTKFSKPPVCVDVMKHTAFC